MCNSLYTVSHSGPQKRKRVIIIGTNMDGGPDLDKIHEIPILLQYGMRRNCTISNRTSPTIFPLAEKNQGRELMYPTSRRIFTGELHTPRYHNSRDIEIFRD